MLGRCKHLILVIFLTMFITSILNVIPQQAAAIGPPNVTVQFDDGYDRQEAEVGLSTAGIVDIPGTVQADIYPGGAIQQIQVNLIASTEVGWGVSISPPNTILTSNEAVPFTLSVVVPPRESCQTVGEVTVSGTAIIYPGTASTDIEPITTTVLVKQFCAFTVMSEKTDASTTPNSEVTLDIIIINQGNGRNIFQVEVDNEDILSDKGFQVSLSHSSIEIDEGSEDKIYVKVKTPSSSSGLGTHLINIKVTSENELFDTPPPVYFDLVVHIGSHNIIFTTEFYIILIVIIAAIIGSVYLIKKRKKKNKKKKG